MKSFTQKFSDTDHTKVVDSYCNDYKYQAEVDDNGTMVTNPESRVDFADRIIYENIQRRAFVYSSKLDDKAVIDSRPKTTKIKRIK